MHVQIVNFNLKGATDEEYRKLCDDLAPTIADVPGLLSKVWLADAGANSYGGVYLWRDRQAMEAFGQSETFKSIAAHPALANLSSTDFGILEGPTALTRSLATANV